MSDETIMLLTALVSFGVAVVVAFAATPLVKRIAVMIGAVDVPRDERRMHKKPIPRLGGLAIFLGFLVSALLFCKLDLQFTGILLGAVVIVTLGVIDDIMALPAFIKFVVQIVAALIPALCGVVVDFISNPFLWSEQSFIEFGVFSIPITVLWIVLITNSVNLIDGLDGLAAGVSMISSFSLLLIALIMQDAGVAMIMAALAGGCVGFLPYNFNPAKMFMGDTGAMFLGYILAVVSVQGLFKFYAIVSFAVPFLILGLPLFDTVFAIFRRISKGKNPMHPDRSHVHHRLIDMGFSQKQAVAILYAMSGMLGLLAVIMTLSGEIRALLLVFAVIAAVAIGAKVMTNPSGSKRNGNSNGSSLPDPDLPDKSDTGKSEIEDPGVNRIMDESKESQPDLQEQTESGSDTVASDAINDANYDVTPASGEKDSAPDSGAIEREI